MSQQADPLRTVQHAHRAALAILAACAIWIATFPASDDSSSPSAVFLYAAMALGVGAITCRQRAVSSAQKGRASVALSVACYSFAAGIGVVGVMLVWQESLRQTALMYTVGGAILALRPPTVTTDQRPNARPGS